MPAKGRLQDTGDSQALLTSYLLGDDDVTVRLVVNFRSSMPAPSLGSFCYWSPRGGCSKARFSNTENRGDNGTTLGGLSGIPGAWTGLRERLRDRNAVIARAVSLSP